MSAILRDSMLGQSLRFLTGKRILKYVDEQDDFVLTLTHGEVRHLQQHQGYLSDSTMVEGATIETLPQEKKDEEMVVVNDVDLPSSTENEDFDVTQSSSSSSSSSKSDLWYSADDQENPRNWSTGKKTFVVAQISIYTFCVYLGSAIFLASVPGVIAKFNVSLFHSTLPISLYVFGYGTGAMLFSPLSEIPSIGRNLPYISSFALFVGISLAAAKAETWATLLALRFLQGFMGSPALATAAATFQDMIGIAYMPYAFTMWIASATMAPAFGPVISGYSVPVLGWRWSLLEIFYLSIAVFVLLATCLPETSAAKILHDRRARLAARYPTETHLLAHLSPAAQAPQLSSMLHAALVRPVHIMFGNPAIAFANFLTCLIYGIYYSFFESFPRVFIFGDPAHGRHSYGFTVQKLGLTLLSITLGGVLGVLAYLPWARWWSRHVNRLGARTPEICLIPALFGVCMMPIGLFIFAWTSYPPYHYILPLVGVVIQTVGIFLVLQCLANYILLAYPLHAASLFAGNDLLRSATGAGALIFSHPMYDALGVAKGISLLASLTVVCCFGMAAMFWWGHVLRKRAEAS